MKQRSKSLFDRGFGFVGMFPPEVLAHQVDAGLEQIYRDPKTFGGSRCVFHTQILPRFETSCRNAKWVT